MRKNGQPGYAPRREYNGQRVSARPLNHPLTDNPEGFYENGGLAAVMDGDSAGPREESWRREWRNTGLIRGRRIA